MSRAIFSNAQLVVAPLGPGDLIDRAVRFYRQNFWTFILVAAPPVVVGTIITFGWTFLARTYFLSGKQFRAAQ